MSFTTTLFKAIHAADTISLNGYEADSIDFKSTNRLDPRDTTRYVEFDLSNLDQDIWKFLDQEVEVDSEGFCEAKCIEDDVAHSFEFRVSRPLTKGDLT